MLDAEDLTTHDPEILLRRIKESFPDVPCKTHRYIDEGWDHEVVIVDDQLVFRFPNDQEYQQLLQTEVSVLNRLRPLIQVDIPKYTHIDKSFAGYRLISGKQLTRKFFDTLSADDRSTIARQLAGLMSVLHTLIEKGYDFTDVALSDMKQQQERLKAEKAYNLSSILSPEDLRVVDGILAKTDEVLGQPLPSVFIHGDIYNRHLLWNDATKQLGVIDFSDMNRGDPAVDFAELHEYGEDFVRQVYDYYTGPKDDRFLQRAWVYQLWVSVYMMVDYFDNHKTSFTEARETFDRVKTGL